MLTFWNLPIQSDGRYLATSISRREGGYSYLKSAAADDHPDPPNKLPPTQTRERRFVAGGRLIASGIPDLKSFVSAARSK
jgi:hypothetical protein